jgi:hypothetical protein
MRQLPETPSPPSALVLPGRPRCHRQSLRSRSNPQAFQPDPRFLPLATWEQEASSRKLRHPASNLFLFQKLKVLERVPRAPLLRCSAAPAVSRTIRGVGGNQRQARAIENGLEPALQFPRRPGTRRRSRSLRTPDYQRRKWRYGIVWLEAPRNPRVADPQPAFRLSGNPR